MRPKPYGGSRGNVRQPPKSAQVILQEPQVCGPNLVAIHLIYFNLSQLPDIAEGSIAKKASPHTRIGIYHQMFKSIKDTEMHNIKLSLNVSCVIM